MYQRWGKIIKSFYNATKRPLAPSTTALSSVHPYVEYRNSVSTLKHFIYY